MRFFSESRSFLDCVVVVSQKSSWFSCVPDFKQSFHIIALSCHKRRRSLPKATSRNFFLACWRARINSGKVSIEKWLLRCCHDVVSLKKKMEVREKGRKETKLKEKRNSKRRKWKKRRRKKMNHCHPHITTYINGLTKIDGQMILASHDQSRVTTMA